MRRPTENFLCSFKCPFCGDRVEVNSETQPDGWSKVQGFCDNNTDKICAIEFDFGVYGGGFTREEMKQSVMEVVGINFIN